MGTNIFTQGGGQTFSIFTNGGHTLYVVDGGGDNDDEEEWEVESKANTLKSEARQLSAINKFQSE